MGTAELHQDASRAEGPPGAATEARSGRGIERLAQRLRERRFSIGIALGLFLAVNFLLLFGYFWSRGGQTTHVRVEAFGSDFFAYVDGKLTAHASYDASQEGGVVLTLEDTDNLPSLPKPRGIDSVRVTDLTSGEVLFEDDFSSGYEQAWIAVSGVFSSEDGVLGVQERGTLVLRDGSWRDYAVDVEFRNIVGGSIMLRAEDSSEGVAYQFRPPGNPFAHNRFVRLDEGRAVDEARGELRIELRRSETIRSLVAMALNPYPLALLLLALGLAAVATLQFVRIPGVLARATNIPYLPWFLVAVLASAAFWVTLFINTSYGSRMPHVPDALSYIFQAKLLASGQLAAPPPPVAEVFDFFVQPFVKLNDGKWASIYPFAHPLLLAIGVKLGAVWLIPPLVGAASVAITFAVGQKVYNARVGLLAALLLASSPFFLMTASNFMSHNSAVFYLLGSLLFLALIDRRPLLFGVLAGLFFGLLFNTRPLTATALVLPFGVFLLSLLLPRDRRGLGAKQVGAFVAGGLAMLVAYWLYNLGTTGDLLTNGYQANKDLSQVVGFSARHTVNVGIQNEQAQMARLLLVLNGWPQYIGLMFVLLPFILATRHRWDWFLLACAVSVMGAYTIWVGDGIMHGPRYWYESIPFLMLLAARGADRTAELLADAAGSLRRTLLGTDGRPLWAALIVVYALVFALVGGSVYGWLFGQHEGWRATFVPASAQSLEGFIGVDDRLIKLVEEAELHNVLVLVENCGIGLGWPCYGSVFWTNSPTLDGDVVFARDVEGRREELLRAFPDRAVYLATYRPPTLVALSEEGQPPAPLAGDTRSSPPAPDRADTALREGEPAAPSSALQ